MHGGHAVCALGLCQEPTHPTERQWTANERLQWCRIHKAGGGGIPCACKMSSPSPSSSHSSPDFFSPGWHGVVRSGNPPAFIEQPPTQLGPCRKLNGGTPSDGLWTTTPSLPHSRFVVNRSLVNGSTYLLPITALNAAARAVAGLTASKAYSTTTATVEVDCQPQAQSQQPQPQPQPQAAAEAASATTTPTNSSSSFSRSNSSQ